MTKWGVNCGIMVVVQNYRWLHLYISMICEPQESITNRHLCFCPQFNAELVDRVVPWLDIHQMIKNSILTPLAKKSRILWFGQNMMA